MVEQTCWTNKQGRLRGWESTRRGPPTRSMGSGKSVPSLGLGFFPLPWEVGAWNFWGPSRLCDLSKLPTERKTPELPVQKKPPFFSLHSAAKGRERGDLLMANIETKEHPFAYSLIKHWVSNLCSVLCCPFPHRTYRSYKCSSWGERVTFLVYTKFSPTSGPLLLLFPPARLPTLPSSSFCRLRLNGISSDHPVSGRLLHLSPSLRPHSVTLIEFMAVCNYTSALHLVIYFPPFWLEYKLPEGKNSVCIFHFWTLSSIYL